MKYMVELYAEIIHLQIGELSTDTYVYLCAYNCGTHISLQRSLPLSICVLYTAKEQLCQTPTTTWQIEEPRFLVSVCSTDGAALADKSSSLFAFFFRFGSFVEWPIAVCWLSNHTHTFHATKLTFSTMGFWPECNRSIWRDFYFPTQGSEWDSCWGCSLQIAIKWNMRRIANELTHLYHNTVAGCPGHSFLIWITHFIIHTFSLMWLNWSLSIGFPNPAVFSQ